MSFIETTRYICPVFILWQILVLLKGSDSVFTDSSILLNGQIHLEDLFGSRIEALTQFLSRQIAPFSSGIRKHSYYFANVPVWGTT